MPVTAKLSRRFYEQFGDDLTNELVTWFNSVDSTYRSDLDRLNELNFARFDAKLEQRLALQEAKWDQRFAHLEVNLERRFGRIEKAMGELRTDMVKWMFAFWTGTLLALDGFLFAILRSRPGA